MTPVTITLIIELLVMIAKVVPKLVPAINDLLEILKGEPVEDITPEEAKARIKAAQDALPPWE